MFTPFAIVVVPEFETEKSVEVAPEPEVEPITKRFVRVSPAFACTVRSAIGEVEPMPMPPSVGSWNSVEVAGSEP
jgi:hypothetical protein